MRNLRLDICYDGTRYRGWQRLAGQNGTIQGKLEQCLEQILGEPVTLSGSGRTDAGVHAAHQIANFHTASALGADEILCALRRYLPEDIGIFSCEEAAERFHARLNAKRKTYRYRIWNSDEPCVFDRRYVYRLAQRLDVQKMREAGQRMLGEHDFSAFCTAAGKKKSTVRRVDALRVESVEREVRITVSANGFLYNMMRILAGTLIEVGQGVRAPESIPPLFGAKREAAGFLAPACGLCLMGVEY